MSVLWWFCSFPFGMINHPNRCIRVWNPRLNPRWILQLGITLVKNAVDSAMDSITVEIKARRGRGQRFVKSTGRYYTSEKRSGFSCGLSRGFHCVFYSVIHLLLGDYIRVNGVVALQRQQKYCRASTATTASTAAVGCKSFPKFVSRVTKISATPMNRILIKG